MAKSGGQGRNGVRIKDMHTMYKSWKWAEKQAPSLLAATAKKKTRLGEENLLWSHVKIYQRIQHSSVLLASILREMVLTAPYEIRQVQCPLWGRKYQQQTTEHIPESQGKPHAHVKTLVCWPSRRRWCSQIQHTWGGTADPGCWDTMTKQFS